MHLVYNQYLALNKFYMSYNTTHQATTVSSYVHNLELDYFKRLLRFCISMSRVSPLGLYSNMGGEEVD